MQLPVAAALHNEKCKGYRTTLILVKGKTGFYIFFGKASGFSGSKSI